MLRGTSGVLRIVLAMAASVGVLGLTQVNATSAYATQGMLHVLAMGDSYTAGNGAGDYYGAKSCYRSHRDYAADFQTALIRPPYDENVTLNNVACSGAVTHDFFHPAGGRPAELDAVNQSYNVIFLTIGGNDADFADIVKYCLISDTRDGANCNQLLSDAENLVSNGTIQSRVTKVLAAIHDRANPQAKIVLLGYPFLEGDTTYTLRSGHGDHAPIIQVGKRLHALNVAADKVDQAAVTSLNDTYGGSTPFVFIGVQKLFDGPPYHGLYAKQNNPNRWMIQPKVDVPLIPCSTCYHPNATGWNHEAQLLLESPNIPKTATTEPASGFLVWGHQSTTNTPHSMHAPTGTTQLVGTSGTDYALTNDGRVFVGTDPFADMTAMGVPPMKQLGGGSSGIYGLTQTGAVWNLDAWDGGQKPSQVPGITNAVAVTGNFQDGYALLSDGTVAAWGSNGVGELGDGTDTDSATPVTVEGIHNVVSIAAADEAAWAVESDGSVWGWGCNGSGGGLGNGDPYFYLTPQPVENVSGAVKIVAGQDTAYALTSGGQVWAWGANGYGQLGNGHTVDEMGASPPVTVPALVPELTGAVDIAATWNSGTYWTDQDQGNTYNGNSTTAYALMPDGTVESWGFGWNGALGNATNTEALSPAPIPGLSNVAAISAGDDTGFARLTSN